MNEILKKSTLFDPCMVSDLFSKVRGYSSLMQLCPEHPIAFSGNKEFVFSMDSDVSIVGENEKKPAGAIGVEPITIFPLKFVYQARVTDEFLRASEEEQISILEAFTTGFARRIAAGFDIAALHGLNPATKEASSVVGNNHFDCKITSTVEYMDGTPDLCLEDALATLRMKDIGANGVIISTDAATDFSRMKDTDGRPLYPEFRFGGCPDTLGACSLTVNPTVSVAAPTNADVAIVGDFANAFRWGYAAQIPLEVIQYGDPDQSGKDLKAYNQVCLRSEVYIGWGILDPDAFVRVVRAAE